MPQNGRSSTSYADFIIPVIIILVQWRQYTAHNDEQFVS